MKVKIEFDSDDFVSMVIDFFVAAGYSVPAYEQKRLSGIFEAAFVEGLNIEVTPDASQSPTVSTVKDIPTTTASSVSEPEAPTPAEIPTTQGLSFAQLVDPSHSDDVPKIKEILSLSKRLERS